MTDENQEITQSDENQPRKYVRLRAKNGKSVAYRKKLLEQEREREKKRKREQRKHEVRVLRKRRARRRATLKRREKERLKNLMYKKRLMIRRSEKIKLRNKKAAERRKLRTIREREKDKLFIQKYKDKHKRIRSIRIRKPLVYVPRSTKKIKESFKKRSESRQYPSGDEHRTNKIMRYMPYDYAAMYIKTLKLGSVREYYRWHRDNGVVFLPKKPHSHYVGQWIGWNEFLGNNNVYLSFDKKPKNALPYWDAVRWAQKFTKQNNINTQAEWIRFIRNHRDELPEGIPTWPPSFYKTEWTGWKVWFGKNIDAIVTANQNKKILLVLCNDYDNPSNSIYPLVSDEGINDLKNQLATKNLKPVMNSKIYELTEAEHNLIQYVFETHGTLQGNFWIIKNVYELLFELDSAFAWYTG